MSVISRASPGPIDGIVAVAAAPAADEHALVEPLPAAPVHTLRTLLGAAICPLLPTHAVTVKAEPASGWLGESVMREGTK